MKTLKELLQKKSPLGKTVSNLDEKTAAVIFRKVIKEEFGAIGENKFKVDYFDGQKFFVKSNSSAWLSELWINRERIIRKMNQELGEEVIKDIKPN